MKVFSNFIFVVKRVWRHSKSFIILRTISATITGIAPAVTAYMLKLLVENIFSYDLVKSLYSVGWILLFELFLSLLTKYIKKKTDLTYDLLRNELKFDLYKKSVEMDYEILASPNTMDKKELALIAINKNFGSKYIDCMFSLISAMISIVSLIYILSVVSWWVVVVVGVIIVLRVTTILLQKKVVYNTQVDKLVAFGVRPDCKYGNDLFHRC